MGSDGMFTLGVVLLVAAVILVLVIRTLQWKKMRKVLFPNGMDGASGKGIVEGHILPWPGLGAQLMARSLGMLATDSSSAARAGTQALKKVQSLAGSGKAIEDVLQSAIETAEDKSTLLRAGDLYVYVVAIPNRHEHAHLLRRHPAFAAGWRQHAELLRSTISADKSGPGFAGMAALLLFVGSDGGESKLQLSCADANSVLIPMTLAEGLDSEAHGAALSNYAMDFKLAAQAR